jgi:hypothetical protein
MRDLLSIAGELVARILSGADVLDKSIRRFVCKRLGRAKRLENSIAEFKFLSGRGHSRGWRFDRYEVHSR